jgi:hypothetical protein
MTLGSIIGQFDDAAFVEETLAALDDIVLMTRLRAAAAAENEPLSDFARTILGRFVQSADDEAWLSLMTTAARAPDPAAASLRCMLSTGLQLVSGLHQQEGHAPKTQGL